MKKIRALRQFSHFHAGNFNQFEERDVDNPIAEALIGMGLAEEAADPLDASEAPPAKKPAKEKAK